MKPNEKRIFDKNSSGYTLGTKIELKNINSFKALGSAIEYELKRQREALENGEKVVQETRGWDENKQRSVSQRSKEEAHDYRYFPEPDLPPFETSVFNVEELTRSLPELPEKKRERFAREYGLSEKQAESLVAEPILAEYFEEGISELTERNPKASPQNLFNYLTSDLKGLVNETGADLRDSKVNPEHLAHLVALIDEGKIMSRQAKEILRKMFETGEDPEEILNAEGLHTISGAEELEKVVQEVLEENPAAVADYKKGKAASLQFLIGKAMGKLKGKGDPSALKEVFLLNLR
jgi:aspartyl-tRNA(Asn)/glutamyl-tRNA(Gln) amidotransferase subunit B